MGMISWFADFLGLVLTLAYCVEWYLGRVQLWQSAKDIKLVFRKIAGYFKRSPDAQ